MKDKIPVKVEAYLDSRGNLHATIDKVERANLDIKKKDFKAKLYFLSLEEDDSDVMVARCFYDAKRFVAERPEFVVKYMYPLCKQLVELENEY